MLKSTYKFLNTLIPTTSNPTEAGSCVCTPLAQDGGGWQVHPPLLPMHVLLLEMVLLCLCVWREGTPRVPARSLSCGSCCCCCCTPYCQPCSPRGTGRMPRQAEMGCSGVIPAAPEAGVWLLCWAPSHSQVSPHSHKFPSIFYTSSQADPFLKSLLVIPWLLLNPADACCK